MTPTHLYSAGLLFAGTALSTPLAAQESEPASRDTLHDPARAQIVVTGFSLEDLNILAGTSVLDEAKIAQHMQPQIGDILTELPGVSATSFTPGASRPVLRGFQGERIRVLTDGIGAIDASNTSADHAVTIDPLTAYRVEVLRGPAALLFGSQAIGGAVNVLDRRIPRAVPDEPVHIDALANYASAYDDRSIAAAIDIPATDRLVFHVDGSYRNTNDVEVPGFVLSDELRAETLAEAAEEEEEGEFEEAEELRELADQRGVVPNTATETWTLGGGVAFIDEWGQLGASVSYYDTNYGIPTRPGAEHAHGEEEEHDEEHDEDHDDDHDDEEHGHGGEEEGPVTIALEQIRADLRGELFISSGFFENARLRLGFSDYEHIEFEGAEVGTRFLVQGLEGRFELVQRTRGGWGGVIGGQLYVRDFNAIGAEAFVPKNDTVQWGVFTLQEYEDGPFGLELAGRYERTAVGSFTRDRSFDAFSGAVGAHYDIAEGVMIGANLSRAERAPSAEELFSDGPHIATQAFEIGNPNFTTEKSVGLEGYLRGTAGPVTFSLTGFASWFDDFIYSVDIGAEEDGLPVFQYFQSDTTYWGFEAEASALLARAGNFAFTGDVVADYVRATIDDAGPVPRIPPFRLLTGIEAQSDMLDARLEAEFVAEQDRVASFETPTDGFVFVNASLAWRPWGEEGGASLFASVNNIFDATGRRHASFTKDFVPLAGRDFRVGARVSF